MNYEALLDEIMVNTLSAKELIGFPQKEFHYAICPRNIEFHSSIFLSSALLALNQEKPLVCLIQVDELPDSAMLYTGQIGPHFGRKWNLKNQTSVFDTYDLPQTQENYYPYLDKLFCYLSVINIHKNHIVIFVKKGEKNLNLKPILQALLQEDYSLLVLSNCYSQLPSEICKQKTLDLVHHFKEGGMNSEESEKFPAISLLSSLIPNEDQDGNYLEQILNTGDLGLNAESSTGLWFMMR